jgi:hypothetical protein
MFREYMLMYIALWWRQTHTMRYYLTKRRKWAKCDMKFGRSVLYKLSSPSNKQTFKIDTKSSKTLTIRNFNIHETWLKYHTFNLQCVSMLSHKYHAEFRNQSSRLKGIDDAACWVKSTENQERRNNNEQEFSTSKFII